MKTVILATAALALASACDQKRPATPAPPAGAAAGPACIAPVSREVTLTAPGARDVLEAQVIGPTCETSALLLTLRKADGSLLWAYSVRATDTWAFDPGVDGQPAAPAAAMQNFLSGVLESVRLETSAAAPDWPQAAERPEDPSGLFHTSPLPREAYLILRARAAPMLCVQAEMGVSHCIAFNPDQGDVAGELYSSSS